MSGERDDEVLEHLLDADPPPDGSADPLAALLRAATTPDHALRGEDAAAAAFRAAFTPEPPDRTPHRRPLQRIRAHRGTSAAFLTAALLVLAALALPRIAGHHPHNGPALTATTAPLTPPPTSPRTPDTTPRPLEDNAVLTTAAQNVSNTSNPPSAAPDPETTETKTPQASPLSRVHHTHTAKK